MRSNPRFGDYQVNRETDPEGCAEEFVRRQAGDAGRGEEDAHDGANRGDGQPDGERADHPLAMQCDLAAANVQVGFAQCKQKKRTKESCSGGLIYSADGGHGEAHHQSACADYQSTDEKYSADDAVRLEMARAKAGAELKRGEEKEEHAGKNVDECEYRIAIEGVVEITESSGHRIGGGRRQVVSLQKRRCKSDDAADDSRAADEGQEG